MRKAVLPRNGWPGTGSAPSIISTPQSVQLRTSRTYVTASASFEKCVKRRWPAVPWAPCVASLVAPTTTTSLTPIAAAERSSSPKFFFFETLCNTSSEIGRAPSSSPSASVCSLVRTRCARGGHAMFSCFVLVCDVGVGGALRRRLCARMTRAATPVARAASTRRSRSIAWRRPSHEKRALLAVYTDGGGRFCTDAAISRR